MYVAELIQLRKPLLLKIAGELFVKYWMLKASAVLGKCTKIMVLPGIEPGTFCV